MIKSLPLIFAIFIGFISGCKLQNDTVIETETPSEIIRVSVIPVQIEVDKISIVFNPETVVDTTITIRTTVFDLNNDIVSVLCNIISPEGITLAEKVQLYDNGSGSDSTGNDGIYSGKINISFKKKDLGSYTIQIIVADKQSFSVNVLSSLNVTNTFNQPPQVSSLVAVNGTIQTGSDSVISKFSVKVEDNQGLTNIKSVNGSIISLDGEYFFAVQFFDDGGTVPLAPFSFSSGDSVAGDGIYSTQVYFLKRHVAEYSILVNARDSTAAVSNTISKQFFIMNQINNKPVVTNVTMPDTAIVPTNSDTTFVKISVTANDAEGLDDIYIVEFTSRRPDNTIVGIYPMHDDGNGIVHPEFNLPSGDLIANDGIFTVTIPLLKGTTVPTYRDFIFQATDRAKEVSSTITKRIYLR